MKKKTELTIKIQSILNELSLTERIDLIERLGKKLRQQNSIETSKEVSAFKIKNGIPLNKVDQYPT